MNKHLIALASALLITGTAPAFAASTVDLTVKGIITPNACNPSLTGGGVIDHGKMSAKDLNTDTSTPLPVQVMQMIVTCDAPVLFALRSTDNRADSSPGDNVFGLGMINGTQSLGSYSLTMDSPLADGVVVRGIISGDNGTTWTSGTSFQKGAYLSVATATGAARPLATQQLVTNVVVNTHINRTDGLDLSNEVNIDGAATLEVMYL